MVKFPNWLQLAEITGDDVVWRACPSLTNTNRLYRTELNGKAMCLRVNAGPNDAFGVSRMAEQQVLALIEGYEWAPDVMACNVDEGWCLTVYHGEAVAALHSNYGQKSLPAAAINQQLFKALGDMARIITGPRFDYEQLIERYHQRLSLLTAPSSPCRVQAQLDELSNLLPTFANTRPGLVHHDLHPGNLCWMEHQQRLVIIDWEYAGIGIPWLDYAQLLSAGLLTASQVDQLVSAQAEPVATVSSNLQRAERINELLEVLWCEVRQH